MPRTLRAAAVLLAASAVIAVPLISVSAANAAPADEHVLVFSNDSYVDESPGQEGDQTLAAVQGSGAVVTTFDGGDGSAAAWTTALTGIDLLVIPEMENGELYNPAGTPALSTAAAAYLKSWVTSGHTVISTGANLAQSLFSFLTGVDYSGVWNDEGPEDQVTLQGTDPSLPPTLAAVDYAALQDSYSTWSTAQKAPVTPIYLTSDLSSLGVGKFAAGTGAVYYVAFDFFPDPTDAGAPTDGWVSALQALVLRSEPAAAVTPAAPVVAAAPVLAATGVNPEAPLWAAGGAIAALIGAALVIVGRIRRPAHRM